MKEQYFTRENIDVVTGKIIRQVRKAVPRQKTRIFDINKAALLILDAQNFFLDPRSHAFIPASGAIIEQVNRLTAFFQKNSRPVIYTRHFNNVTNACNMGKWWGDLLVKNSAPFELNDRIVVVGGSILDKAQYDAFHDTELSGILAGMHVEQVVICGVMTNLCCETTARSAFVKGYKVWMPVDATATYNLQLHIASFTGLSFGFLPLHLTHDLLTRAKRT